jgi:hypothetical protein
MGTVRGLALQSFVSPASALEQWAAARKHLVLLWMTELKL